MGFSDARRSAIARFGRPMSLQRKTGGSNTNTPITTTNLTVQGFLSAYRPEQLSTDIKQGDALVAITNDELAAAGWDAPRARDQVEIDGHLWVVIGSQALYVGGTCIGHAMQVRGGS